MIIAQEDIDAALVLQDAAPDIIVAAEAALIARGVTDGDEVIAALFAAAWRRHKDMAGPNNPLPFVRFVRGWIGSIEAMANPN